MKPKKPSKIGILPRNFEELLGFYHHEPFEREVKFGRFKIDFYSRDAKLAFEYDGIQHYSIIQKIESDKRKDDLMKKEKIKLVRWPYYFMPTRDTCKYVFRDCFTEKNFNAMLENMFGIMDEADMMAPGFHSTPNIPANFIWPGIDKFLTELSLFPKSIRDQVRYSLKLYCEVRKNNNNEIVIPTYHKRFMEFYTEMSDPSNLNFAYKNVPKRT